jgi:hypothetical protein
MRSRAWLAVVPLIAVLIALSSSVPGVLGRCCGDKAAAKKGPKPDDPCAGYACMVILFANYGDYCSYYAQLCTGDPTNLQNILYDDTNCSRPCTGPFCSSCPSDNCVNLGSELKKKKSSSSGNLHSSNGVKRGLSNPADPAKIKVPPVARKSITPIGDPIFASLETQPGTFKTVMLFVVLIDPTQETDADKKKNKPRVYGTGVEVDPMKLPTGAKVTKTISNDSLLAVDMGGKVCQVLVDNLVHQVVLFNKATMLKAGSKKK